MNVKDGCAHSRVRIGNMVELEAKSYIEMKMDHVKRRFYILGLSLLVLIIALAGLLGILDSLPGPSSATTGPGNVQPITTPPGDNGGQPQTTAAPTTTTPGNENPPQMNITPRFSMSLPKSLDVDISKPTNPGLSLDSATSTHIPILEVTGAENTEYLKSVTASTYDGAEWVMENLADYIEYNGELTIPEGVDPNQIVTDDITVATLVDIINGKVAIPTSLYPVSIDSSEPLLYFPDDMTFLSEEEFPEEYTFETIHFIYDRQQLANADLELLEEYLQLPDNITPRTYELAETLTGGIESPYYMAKAIEDYLKTKYTYDYDFTPAPAGQEPNDWFLFEEKSGVCTNFNSAFVVLSRAAGIPARLVGGFHINAQEAAQDVYTDQAHAWAEVKFKDLGWVTFDATGSTPALQNTVTEITSISPEAEKGVEFTVAGTVLTDTTQPADGVLVEIMVNETKDAEGAVLVGQGIVADGHYEIKAIIPGDVAVGEYHVLAHSLKSSRYRESWSDPVIKVVAGTEIDLQYAARIRNGDTLTLEGTLTEKYGEALGGQQLQIYLNDKPVANPVTDSNGGFKWAQSFNEPGKKVIRVTYGGTEYYKATASEAEFRVLAPAVIEIKANGGTTAKPAEISGRLAEAGTGSALAGRTLAVLIDGELKDIKPVTGDNGKFEFNYNFEKPGTHKIEVKFAGDEQYYEAAATVNTTIATSSGFPIWMIIVIAAGLAAVAIGGWFLYRYLKNKPAPTAESKPEEIAAVPTAATPWESTGDSVGLTIEFPQIKEPLPEVWGIDEELTIGISLADEVGTGIAAPLEVLISNEGIIKTTTGKDGKAEVRHTYKAKGEFNIAAKYEESPVKKASAARTIRIVDYREEIVSLFNRLVAELRRNGINVSDEFTPRKIQWLVLNADKTIPEKAMEDAVNCFEETDYSLHPITRQHYETMYLAQKEITEHGTRPAAAAQDRI